MKKPSKNSIDRLSSYDYGLPTGLIAQKPMSPRDAAKLMILDKKTGEISHRRFFDLPEILSAGDVLVFNDSKVIPARLLGRKQSGGKIEVFLLKKAGKDLWQCLVKGRVGPGQKIIFKSGVSAVLHDKVGKVWLARFNAAEKKMFAIGETPLPPYIKTKSKMVDYQTVYARVLGSVAAPTAGLHFTKRLMSRLKKSGAQIEFVTLHVGLGTFQPVETENIIEHKMHSEAAEIDGKTAERLNQAKRERRRIIAVGTTACRTLESCTDKSGLIKPKRIETDIFIHPGYKFKFVDELITNFHLPKSTLLMLVSALAGKKNIDRAYKAAIKEKYRFFSFGDGMMIK